MLLTSKLWNCALTFDKVDADFVVDELLNSRGIDSDEKKSDDETVEETGLLP